MSEPTNAVDEQYRDELEALGRDLARLLADLWLARQADQSAATTDAAPPAEQAPDAVGSPAKREGPHGGMDAAR